MKIFLASSSDLKKEREEFERHLGYINKQWANAGVLFELVIWEHLLGTVSDTRKQDDYNKKIQECDVFVLLFFDKIGQYTLEEFNVAIDQFKTKGKPRILTYFNGAPVKNVTREIVGVLDFKEKLKELGHFWSEYENVHQLILNFYMQLGELANEGFFGNKKFSPLEAPAVLPKELTLAMPKTHPKDIIGRDKELDNLHELLSTDKRVVVVNGLGGVGKTTLAQAYLSKYYDEYHHIGWIAQSSDNIASDFINAAGLLDHLSIAAKGTDIEELFNQLIGKLKDIPSRPNLLIIDNATESLEKYFDILPTQPHWHLLVTSREKIEGFYLLPLDFLSEGEAIALFKKYYTGKRLGDDDIKKLVVAVDYHTLTIEILAKTATAQRYELDVLLQAIKKNVKSSAKVRRDKQLSSIEKVGSYLQSVFNISNLEEMELWLMKQFACLPGEFNTYDLLYDLLLGKEDPRGDAFAETLDGLVGKGWLLYNSEADAYKMHRVIAQVVSEVRVITVEDVYHLLTNLIGKLFLDASKENPIDKLPWIPFGRSMYNAIGTSETHQVAVLQNNLAQRLRDIGEYREAKSLLQSATKIVEKLFGIDDARTSLSYANLALVLRELGEYTEAKSMVEKALSIDEKLFGPDHAKVALRLSNLAMVTKVLGDYDKARALLERALEIDEKQFGPDHPRTAVTYSNLGLVLTDLRDYQTAKLMLEKACRINEQHLGPNHPHAATTFSNLALVYRELHENQMARSMLEKVVKINEQNFGQDHPTTAVSYSNMGMVLSELEEYSEAIPLLMKALVFSEEKFGPLHSVTAKRNLNLATVLQRFGNYEEALAFAERGLEIYTGVFSEGHPSIKNAIEICQSIKDAIKSK